jgi:hypothetical protein
MRPKRRVRADFYDQKHLREQSNKSLHADQEQLLLVERLLLLLRLLLVLLLLLILLRSEALLSVAL